MAYHHIFVGVAITNDNTMDEHVADIFQYLSYTDKSQIEKTNGIRVDLRTDVV